MLKFNKTNIFNTFDGLESLDIKKYKILAKLEEKYHIDYFGIHAIDKDLEYLYSIRGNEDWHNYFWKNNMINTCKAVKQLLELHTGSDGILFFNTYLSPSTLNTRALIIGEKKSGLSFLFQSKKTNNKFMFCVTFQESSKINGVSCNTIQNMSKNILLQLTNDLYKCIEIIEPYLIWYKRIGNLIPTPSLKKELDKTPFILPF